MRQLGPDQSSNSEKENKSEQEKRPSLKLEAGISIFYSLRVDNLVQSEAETPELRVGRRIMGSCGRRRRGPENEHGRSRFRLISQPFRPAINHSWLTISMEFPVGDTYRN